MKAGNKILSSIKREVIKEAGSQSLRHTDNSCSEASCNNQCGNDCTNHSDAGE